MEHKQAVAIITFDTNLCYPMPIAYKDKDMDTQLGGTVAGN